LLLLWLLVAVQAPGVTPEYDLTSYLAVAAGYGSADHAAALKEIREWPPGVVRAAVADLRRRSRQFRAVPTSPGDIAFGTVEAAVLMHAEAGLLALESQNLAEAANHLGASVALYQWSRDAATEAQNWAETRQPPLGPTPGLEIRPRIDSRDFSVALAAAALAAGSPTTAQPFAEKARRIAPLDPEVQLLYGCVAEGLAEEQLLRHRESAAADWRDQATVALLDALALDGGLLEVRLRLGRLLVVQGHEIEAEPIIDDAHSSAAVCCAREAFLAADLPARCGPVARGPAAVRPRELPRRRHRLPLAQSRPGAARDPRVADGRDRGRAPDPAR
jgi:hypothetical protein